MQAHGSQQALIQTGVKGQGIANPYNQKTVGDGGRICTEKYGKNRRKDGSPDTGMKKKQEKELQPFLAYYGA